MFVGGDRQIPIMKEGGQSLNVLLRRASALSGSDFGTMMLRGWVTTLGIGNLWRLASHFSKTNKSVNQWISDRPRTISPLKSVATLLAIVEFMRGMGEKTFVKMMGTAVRARDKADAL